MPAWAPEAFQSGLVLGALLGLVLYNCAVLAEIMRAGILSLPRGQGEAAAALGMTYRQAMRHVILPQGLRRMVPATVSQLITLNKDTTLVSIIAITEVMRRGRIVTSSSFFADVQAPILQVFIFIGVLFVLVNHALSRLSRRLEIRERKITGTSSSPWPASRTSRSTRPDVRVLSRLHDGTAVRGGRSDVEPQERLGSASAVARKPLSSWPSTKS